MILQNVFNPIVHVRYKVHTVLFEKGKGACLLQGCRNRGGRGCVHPPDFDGSVNPISTRLCPPPQILRHSDISGLLGRRTQKSKAKRRKLKKFISINLQWLSFFFLSSQFSLPVSFLFSQVFLLLPFVVVVVLSVISHWGETISKVAFIVFVF